MMNRRGFFRSASSLAFLAAVPALEASPTLAPKMKGRMTPEHPDSTHLYVLRNDSEVPNVAWWDFDTETYLALHLTSDPIPRDPDVIEIEVGDCRNGVLRDTRWSRLMDRRTGKEYRP